MLKKTISFPDYNGVTRTEDFYFNLTEAEVTELELSKNGGFTAVLNRLISTQDFPTIVAIFKELILKAYGVKSDDGRRMIKNDQVRADFEQTEAYSILFMELATDANAASKFIKGILPKKFAEAAEKGETALPTTPLTPVQ